MSRAKEREEQPKFSICPSCRAEASGTTFSRCSECGGAGRVYRDQDEVMVWDYALDALHIMLRMWYRTIRTGIDVGLVILLLCSILILFFMGLSVDFEAQRWLELLFMSFDQLFGLFWFIMIFNLYLFYRMLQPQKHIRVRLGHPAKTAGLKPVNVADLLHDDVITLLDNSWSAVYAARQLPIRPMQLMLACLQHRDILMIMARLGLPVNSFTDRLLRQIAYYPPRAVQESISPEAADIMLNAYLIARKDHSQKVRATDVFYATILADEKIQELLYDLNVDLQKVANVIKWINFNNALLARYRRFRSKALYKPKGPINRSFTAAATPFLDSFSTDLTQLARVGYLPVTVGRENEMEELHRVMEGGRSVVLVGEKGVGKMNIIESLANSMAAEDVPPMFQDKRLVSLSLSFLVAGASRTGEVHERLLMIVQEIERSGNIILAIQDIHNLVGITSVGTESIDLSDVLAQEIKNGMLWVVATSTPADMTESVERSALSEVFERVQVSEPDRNKAIQILESKVGTVEAKYGVYFTYEALERLVDFSDRYLYDQFLPAKAITLMTEAGSWIAQRDSKLVTGEDIAAIVSRKTNIPLTRVTQEESEKLLNLDRIMHERIVGQEEAVNLVVSALRRARAELRDEKRPIVNLLFLGPTGVGKTELAKTVAAVYFGDENAMIRLDMSEYQTQDSLARLLGLPGSNRGGTLTEAVRARPFSLLLLDEIEKAHPDILNIFLQVMDDGRLTDAMGRTVDFTNIILVATSNAGSHFIQDEVMKGTDVESIKTALIRGGILREIFRPEFLNRFDGVVVFRPLSQEEIYTIAGLMLNKVQKRLEQKGIALTVTPDAQAELATAGFDPIFGARPLRRVIQERVEEALANFLLKGSIGRRDQVVLDVGGKITVSKAAQL